MKNSPIFIVGCPRSGTTLLRLMLNQHPQVAIPEETWFFPDLFRKLPAILELDEWRKKIAETIFELNSNHFPEWTPSDLMPVLMKTDKKDWPGIIGCLNITFALREKKTIWGDKTPGYVLHLPLIKRLYPNSKIIHIIRDGRDVTPSMLRYWSVGPQSNSYIETAYYWKQHVSTGMKYGPTLFRKNYLEIKYEDLILNPEQKLKSICDQIKLDYDDNMLRFDQKPGQYLNNWEWHQKLYKPLDSSSTAKWRLNPNQYQLASFNLVAGRLNSNLGYQKKNVYHLGSTIEFVRHTIFFKKKRLLYKAKRLLYLLMMRWAK